MPKPIIKIEGLRKVYIMGKDKVVALNNLSLTVEESEICCLLGTSGSGKSTLLNMMAGLEKPTKGTITISGQRVDKLSERKLAKFRQKNLGFVFQSYNLLPSLTAIENTSLPLAFRGMGLRKRTKKAIDILKAVGLGDRLKHKPTQMSGGQQQRVGIARAFVSQPAIILADEPTGNLDSKTTNEVMEMIVNMVRRNKQTLILVTHEQEIARFADKIVQIKDGNIEKIIINKPQEQGNENIEIAAETAAV